MSRFGQRTLVGTNREVSGLGKKPPAGIGVVQGYGVATGGTQTSITVGTQAYTLLSFLSDGSLVVSSAGMFDVLLLGGGGASGSARSNFGTSGGGGAGGLLQQTIYLETGTYTVDVGAGGPGGVTNALAAQGLPSSIIGLSAPFAIFAGGGGGGGSPYAYSAFPTTAGGSSGGAANNGASKASTVSGCGNSGGAGGASGSYDGGGGGGGGAGSAGGNGSGSTGGNGGNGTDIATFLGSGSAVTVGGGGGGGGTTAGSNGTGTGSANSGGGRQGKSAASNQDGDAGYSGRVAVRFKV